MRHNQPLVAHDSTHSIIERLFPAIPLLTAASSTAAQGIGPQKREIITNIKPYPPQKSKSDPLGWVATLGWTAWWDGIFNKAHNFMEKAEYEFGLKWCVVDSASRNFAGLKHFKNAYLEEKLKSKV